MKTLVYFVDEITDSEELHIINSMPVAVIGAEVGELENLPYPDECLVIASSHTTVREARQFGAAVVGYQRNRAQMAAFLQVDYVIEGFEEVDFDFLEKIYMRHHGQPWIISRTDRCILRELSISDIDALFALYSKPGVTDYMEPLFEYSKEVDYEKAYIKNMYGYFGYGMWLVFHKENGELIGRAGLEHREYPEGTELEMGYVISPDYQRQGYATEVCSCIIDYAREYTEYDRLNCLIHDDNKASIALVEKLGFDFAGHSEASGERLRRYILNFAR